MAEEMKTQGTETESVAEPVYENREELDAKLSEVIADILSAEQEAGHIIARAEENAKATHHGGAGEMRSLRETSSRMMAEARTKKLEDASLRAAAEREKRVKKAQEQGEKLIKEKEKKIAERINQLYAQLGGKA
ncbi:MAG: hypothetical protein J1F71_01590 [Clostridiales bacterium]|nr:hypothetical protein [Clostridiales bacterium]